MALVDALGCLVTITILPGQRHDLVSAPPLIDDLDNGALTGDKAFDTDWLLRRMESCSAILVIPAWSSQEELRDTDHAMYGLRHQIENLFAKFKDCRAVATRYCRAASSFRATVHSVAAVIARK